jgi:hypothetical protein
MSVLEATPIEQLTFEGAKEALRRYRSHEHGDAEPGRLASIRSLVDLLGDGGSNNRRSGLSPAET